MKDITPHEAARRMNDLRVSAEKLARRVGISPDTVRKFVNRHYATPHRMTRHAICEGLDLFEADEKKIEKTAPSP